MNQKTPRVSIGLPVYNAETFLAETLDSLLAQTYTDFELIISDNASTDGTEQMCRSYAERDSRIRYTRNDTNIGGSKNFNRLFWLASGEYFKWAAADDLCAPTYLERCVEVLDHDPSVVLCFTQTQAIDGDGTIVHDFPPTRQFDARGAHTRFLRTSIFADPQNVVFGLIRSDVLRQTRLIGSFSAADRILISELALMGRLYEVPEYLFFYRHHEQQSWRLYASAQQYAAWFDPQRARKTSLTQWRLLLEHFISICRAQLPWYQKVMSYTYLVYWMRYHAKKLLANVLRRDIRHTFIQNRRSEEQASASRPV